MESVIVFAPCPYMEIFIQRLAPLGTKLRLTDGQVAYFSGRYVVLVNEFKNFASEADPTDTHLWSIFSRYPYVYLFDYTALEDLQRVLYLAVDDPLLWVDNDHEVSVPGDEFVAMLKANPDWDWRID